MGTTTYQVSDVTPGTLYEFVVAPISAAGEGEKSVSVAQSTAPAAPGTPTAAEVTTTTIALAVGRVDIPSGDPITHYNVYHDGATGSGEPATLAGTIAAGEGATVTVVAGSDGALSAGTTYRLAVRAVSDAGESPLSAVVEVTTATE